jgi:DNA-binding PadR family transcriptional regulator
MECRRDTVDLTQWNVKAAKPVVGPVAGPAAKPAEREGQMPERPLNATAASLLGFLHQGQLTGWDLVQTAEREIGDFWSLTRSQVYRELAAMAEVGLVEAGERGPRDRRPYSLTEAGRSAFAEWVRREPGPESIRFPLLLTVLFGRYLPSEELERFLELHRSVHARRLAGYRRQHREALAAGAGDAEPYTVATLEFGIAYERAVLSWFDRLPPKLRASTGRRSPSGHIDGPGRG